MADSRRIIRGSRPVDRLNDGLDRIVTVPAVELVTDARTINTGGSDDPTQLLAADERRRGSNVYNPATDPAGINPTQALVWVSGDENAEHWFPLETGAAYFHEAAGPLYVWTAAASASRLYIATERD